jgi:hypothetical protein
MTYGSLPDQYRQAGIYVGRISQGGEAGRSPGNAADKVRARHQLADGQIGLAVPPTLLALADEVIE